MSINIACPLAAVVNKTHTLYVAWQVEVQNGNPNSVHAIMITTPTYSVPLRVAVVTQMHSVQIRQNHFRHLHNLRSLGLLALGM